jgi:hypothetical protein
LNREDIIRMAREAWLSDKEAQLITEFDEAYISCTYVQDLENFASLVASAEREACAKLCEDLDAWNMDDPASTAAEAIRARDYKQDGQCKYCTDGCPACDARKLPEQEPVACKDCHLKDLVYDLLGELKVANLKLSVRAQRAWVGLTYEEQRELYKKHDMDGWGHFYNAIEAKLKEKNT